MRPHKLLWLGQECIQRLCQIFNVAAGCSTQLGWHLKGIARKREDNLSDKLRSSTPTVLWHAGCKAEPSIEKKKKKRSHRNKVFHPRIWATRMTFCDALSSLCLGKRRFYTDSMVHNRRGLSGAKHPAFISHLTTFQAVNSVRKRIIPGSLPKTFVIRKTREGRADWGWTVISARGWALCIFPGPYYRREE